MTPVVRGSHVGWETVVTVLVVAVLAVAAFAIGHRPTTRAATAAPAPAKTVATGGAGTAVRQTLGDAAALPAMARRPARRRRAPKPVDTQTVTTETTPAQDTAPVVTPTPVPTPTPAPAPAPAPSTPAAPKPTTPNAGQTFDDAG